jgi:hypothetical protein
VKGGSFFKQNYTLNVVAKYRISSPVLSVGLLLIFYSVTRSVFFSVFVVLFCIGPAALKRFSR